MPDILVKSNAKLPDTINLIVSRINTDWNTPYIRGICEGYNAADPDRLAFLARLQDYVHRNVRYVLDKEGSEYVYQPTTTILNGKGDCKKMTVIIGSALRCANIPFFIKHVFYLDEDFTHVYIISPYPNAKGYITLDPVMNPYFDQEVSYESANVYDKNGTKMDLYTGKIQVRSNFASGSNSIMNDLDAISGSRTGCSSTGSIRVVLDELSNDATMSGVGRKSKEERKERRENLKEKVKQVGLQIPRTVFLGLVNVNAAKFADKLVRAWKKDKNAVIAMWDKLGGDPNALKKAIITGSKTQISGTRYMTGIALEAALATAAPVIIIVVKLLKDLKAETAEGEEGSAEVAEAAEAAATKPKPVKFTATAVKANATAVKNQVVAATGVAPSEGQPDPTPTVGGDAFTEATSWDCIFYQMFRAGFYIGLPNMFTVDVHGFAIPEALKMPVFITGNLIAVYYIFIKQPFVRSQLSKLNFKIATR